VFKIRRHIFIYILIILVFILSACKSDISSTYNIEQYSYEKLNQEQKILYDEIKPKIFNLEAFSYSAEEFGYDTLDNLLLAWGALKTDYPEINIYFKIWENNSDEGITRSLDSRFYCVWDENQSQDIDKIKAGLELFNKECEIIIAGIPKKADDYNKYLYLAVEISKRVQYDYDFAHPGYATAYSIVTGYAICNGYSELYQYLCAKAGLWCHFVEGQSQNTSHAWNLIKLDGGTYHVDVTWSSELGEPGDENWMKYFKLTQEQILLDHVITDGTIATGK